MKRRILVELLFLCILSLVGFFWLAPGEIIHGHDSGTRLNEFSYWRDTFFSWNPTINFGKDWSIAKGFLITKVPELAASATFHSHTLGQQLAIALWLFLIGVSMYITVRLLFPRASTIMRLWASTLYMYNFFVLQGWWIFERAKFATYAALPLVFAVLVKGLTRQYSIAKTAVLIGLILFFGNGGGSPPLYGALLVVCVATWGIVTIHNIRRHGRQELLYSITLAGTVIAVWIAFNAYWILPEAYLYTTSYQSMLAAMGGTEGILSWEAMFSTNASYLNILRLQGLPGWEAPLHPYAHAFLTHPLLILASFIPFLLSLWTLIQLIRRHSGLSRIETPQRQILYTLIVLIPIGLFFTAGTHPPFGFLFAALVRYVPGFAIFRSSFFKFFPAVIFPVAMLSAYGLAQLTSRIRPILLRTGLAGLALTALIMYHYPYVSRTSFDWTPPFTTKVTIPSYVSETISYLESHSTPSDRTLLLPELDPAFHQDSYTWGYWSLTPLIRNASSLSIVANDSNNPPSVVAALYDAIRRADESSFLRLAGIANIKHILWRHDILYNDAATTSESTLPIKHTLDTFSSLSPAATFGAWQVYTLTSETKLVETTPVVTDIIDPNYDIESALSTSSLHPIILRDAQPGFDQGAKRQLIRARCVYCRQEQRDSLANTFQFPTTKIVPTHPLYPFVETRERTILSRATKPEAKVDAHFSFAMKRLAELMRMEHSQARERVIRRYESHMEEVRTHLANIEGIHKGEYVVKLYIFGTRAQEHIKKEAPAMIAELQLLDKLTRSLPVVATSDMLDEYLHVAAPENDTYTLRVAGNAVAIPQMRMNNVPIKNGQTIELIKGLHELDIEMSKKIQGNVPAVYLEREVGNPQTKHVEPTAVIYHNPTLTTVTMPPTDGPTLLIFNQHMNPGWILKQHEKREANFPHIQVYGFANGWILPKLAEPTTFTISYYPQQIFYIGLGVTIISFVCIGLLTLMKRGKIIQTMS